LLALAKDYELRFGLKHVYVELTGVPSLPSRAWGGLSAAVMATTQSKNERLKTYQPAVLQDICASAASTSSSQTLEKAAAANLDSPGT
jgi:hypothetical protein